MFKLLRENIRIAMGSIRTQLLRTILTVLIIAIGITALVGILTLVAALENSISKDFASMGSNTFNITQYDITERMDGDRSERKPNPIISYPQAKGFVSAYNFPYTHSSLSFTATSKAEVKFESKKTDPEISVLGVDEYFLINSGTEISQGRNFTPAIHEGIASFAMEQQFRLEKDDAIYGLGQHQDGVFNYRGEQVNFFQNNTEVAVPFMISVKNYGVLWDNYSLT
ncbi:MAG: hypothetical protein EOO48_13920, partial [Flavobacterium sp.]